MHQTKKGNQWHFGMKAHIGVDAETGLAHSLETTPANGSDVATAHAVLHGGEEEAWGDAGYQGVGKRAENKAAAVWRTARSGKRRLLDKSGPRREAQGLDPRRWSVSVRETALLREGALPGSGEGSGSARFLESAHRRPLRHGVKRGTIAPGFRPNRETGRKSTNSQFPGRFRTKRKHFSTRKWIPDCEARVDALRRPETGLDQTFPRGKL